jgi:hypothetical protein
VRLPFFRVISFVGLSKNRDHLLLAESRLFHGSLSGQRAPFSQASGGPNNTRQVKWANAHRAVFVSCNRDDVVASLWRRSIPESSAVSAGVPGRPRLLRLQKALTGAGEQALLARRDNERAAAAGRDVVHPAGNGSATCKAGPRRN